MPFVPLVYFSSWTIPMPSFVLFPSSDTFDLALYVVEKQRSGSFHCSKCSLSFTSLLSVDPSIIMVVYSADLSKASSIARMFDSIPFDFRSIRSTRIISNSSRPYRMRLGKSH